MKIECVLTVLLGITLTPMLHVSCCHKIVLQLMSKVYVQPASQDGQLRMVNVYNNSATCHYVLHSTRTRLSALHALRDLTLKMGAVMKSTDTVLNGSRAQEFVPNVTKATR